MNDDEGTLSVADIRRILPHRYPFLLLDRVVELEPGARIRACKNVSANEPFFQGHFPQRPVMPGVLIIEAMAQAGGVLAHQTEPDLEPKPLYYLVGVDAARVRRPVLPGDRLDIELTVEKVRRRMWRFAGVASVADRVAATATIMTAPGGDGG
ncbi:MAG: 3-hydroxyacyl-ACP dehydratase FabZ [Woeseiaceae bacterium]|nr:3-hydroxyacyl-ACP dehydratase FabZ [Woeseiaceae bacterium]